MKSNNRNDVIVYHPVEDIELLPPESTGTYIETTEALAVEEDDNHTTNRDNIIMNGTNCTGNAMVSSSLCRSKCHINDIPDVARNLTWKDQFYEVHDNGSTDIIAAFDIDRTVYDQTAYEILKWFILAPGFSIPVFPIYFVIPPLGIMLVIYYATLLCVYLNVNSDQNEKRLLVKRSHVAISSRGIFIDEANGHNLMRRSIVSYNKIKECKVFSEDNGFYGKTHYNVTINTIEDVRHFKEGHLIAIIPKHTIEGLQKPQKFVDIVNAMVERHTERTTSSTTTGTSMDNCCREVIEVDVLV